MIILEYLNFEHSKKVLLLIARAVPFFSYVFDLLDTVGGLIAILDSLDDRSGSFSIACFIHW